MKNVNSNIDIFTYEQAILEKYRQTQPELVASTQTHSFEHIMQHIGIVSHEQHLPVGYTNLYPQDFIVEEIGQNNEVSTIDLEQTPPRLSEGNTIYADMIKVGLSTAEAINQVCQALEIEPKNIGYAGIKDKVAITSQQIAIRNTSIEQVAQLDIPGIILKNIRQGKGTINPGQLNGNRFTITVRTATPPGEGWLQKKVQSVQNGFFNYYYLQRFGTPRLISHKLGKLLLQQRYEETIKTFITDPGVQTMPLINQLREKARQHFGNWHLMYETLSELPYTFRLELQLLEFLINRPTDFKQALHTIQDQIILWVYAYASYATNLELSQRATTKNYDTTPLPLLMHPDYKKIATYVSQLEKDKINNLELASKEIFRRDVFHAKNTITPIIKPTIHKVIATDIGCVFNFDLPTGTYATTLLSNLFQLQRVLPIPDWVQSKKIDAKHLLGTGSIAATELKLGNAIFSHVNENRDT